MPIGMLTLHLLIPGCTSLKEKRSHVKPIVARLHREFNLSVAEMGRLDAWQETEIACVTISNDVVVVQRTLQSVTAFVESHWPDCPISSEKKEII
jgi:uncharacterized protein